MVKRLVQLDDEVLYFMEIDEIKLKRVALLFRKWLENIDPKNDPFQFLKKDMPLVEAALNGTLKLPYSKTDPHSWEMREGTIPDDYINVSSEFYNTIRGEHLVPPNIIEKDGHRYAWMYFEEEGEKS